MNRLALLPVLLAASLAQAAPTTYVIDPAHTFPSFEADHMGMSYWRGKLNKNSGSIVYDKATGAGSVDVQMDLASIDFGLDALNDWAKGEQFFNVAKNPSASFKGRDGNGVSSSSSMLAAFGRSRGVHRVIARPLSPARPVRPTRWVWVSGSCAMS